MNCCRFTTPVLLLLVVGVSLSAETKVPPGQPDVVTTPRVLPPGHLPGDRRLGPLVDLNKHYFAFTPPDNLNAWTARAAELRRQMLVATGLWPMPTMTPAAAVVHGKIDRGDYTVEKVYLESFPGHFVTGNLYRPKNAARKRPGVLSPHGHFKNGRFYDCGPKQIRWELVEGRERFENAGRYPLQARCVQLARMGCVVFHYDMVGYADNIQLQHRPGVRDRMNSPHDWGYFSPQAELRLQNMMGLQTYNSLRALDWLCSLPDVDSERIGVTGASGGGTQTFVLAAIDPRPKVAVPAVMVSTAMQGGCSCENAPYLRIGTGNVELAALIAPRRLGLLAADDWTREIMTKGFPELQAIYKLFGRDDDVTARALVQFPHNYNYVSRAVMYRWLNKYFDLGFEEPIVEEDFKPLSRAEMTVWDDDHPRPPNGDGYERSLLRWITEDAEQQLALLAPNDEQSLDRYREVVGGAWDILIGRRAPEPKTVVADHQTDVDQGDWILSTLLLNQPTRGESVPIVLMQPKRWNRQVVIWIDKQGKQALFGSDGQPRAEAREMLHRGFAVIGVDLFGQGEFTDAGRPVERQRIHPGDKEKPFTQYAGFTFGYNQPLFCQRVHDVLAAVAFARDATFAPDVRDRPPPIWLVGLDGAGRWAIAAKAQAGPLVDKLVVDTGGFRFANVTSFDDPDFVPGSVKYLDLPGLLALCAPDPLYLLGEATIPPIVRQSYDAAGGTQHVQLLGASSAERHGIDVILNEVVVPAE